MYFAVIHKYTLIKQSKLFATSIDLFMQSTYTNNDNRLSTILILEHNFEYNR